MRAAAILSRSLLSWRVAGLFAFVALAAMSGCAPVIGDGCETSLGCSVNGDRICDLAQPGGACTIQGCEADTCPDNAVCVRFRPDPPRLAETWCMRGCTADGQCRKGDGYQCMSAEELGTFEVEPGVPVPVAEVVDVEEPDRHFCIAP